MACKCHPDMRVIYEEVFNCSFGASCNVMIYLYYTDVNIFISTFYQGMFNSVLLAEFLTYFKVCDVMTFLHVDQTLYITILILDQTKMAGHFGVQ